MKNQISPLLYISKICNAIPDKRASADFITCLKKAATNDIPAFLEKWPVLDWDAYITANPDVRAVGLDPVQHFTKFGIFENRKLHIRPGTGYPHVSVIIASYNNGVFLRKCLESVLRQTLRNIEILVIDDSSTDNSVDILKSYQQKDNRIVFTLNETNMSQHMSRKRGVAMARGEYIMFVDSDDYIRDDACELASRAIAPGYDFACFNTAVIDFSNSPAERINRLLKHYNSAEAGEYRGRDYILYNTFIDKKLTHNIWNKIFESGVCKQAFAEMEDGFYPGAQDLYEFLAIASKSKCAVKFNETLYYHGYGLGFSNPEKSREMPRFFELPGDVMAPVERFVKKNGLQLFLPSIKKILLAWSMDKWLNQTPTHLFITYLQVMATQYGFADVFNYIAENFHDRWSSIANRLYNYKLETWHDPGKKMENIAVVARLTPDYPEVGRISEICRQLGKEGKNVKLFLEDNFERRDIAAGAARMLAMPYTRENIQARLRILRDFLETASFDLVIYVTPQSGFILWDMLLMSFMEIPVLLDYQGSYSEKFLAEKNSYLNNHNDNVIRCADAMLCQSRFSELYYRQIGCNAAYLPQVHDARSFKAPVNISSIMVVDDFDAENCVPEKYIKIIAPLAKDKKEFHAFFYGNFENYDKLKTFLENVNEAGLENNISVIGLPENICNWVDKCCLLLSLSGNTELISRLAESHNKIAVMPAHGGAKAQNNIIQTYTDNPFLFADAIKKLSGSGAVSMNFDIENDEPHVGSALFHNAYLNAVNSFSKMQSWEEWSELEYKSFLRDFAWFSNMAYNDAPSVKE